MSVEDPIACRSVAKSLFAFAAVVEGFAVSHALAGDETGAERLKEHARELQETARRLYDQKGIIRDTSFLVMLLEQAVPFIEASSFQPALGNVFLHRDELLAAIARHTQDA